MNVTTEVLVKERLTELRFQSVDSMKKVFHTFSDEAVFEIVDLGIIMPHKDMCTLLKPIRQESAIDVTPVMEKRLREVQKSAAPQEQEVILMIEE